MKLASLLSALAIVCASYANASTEERPNLPKTKSGLKAAQEHFEKRKKQDEKSKAIAAIKLVNINSASVQELKALPGISNDDAAKIISARPYGSKSWLVTNKVISPALYAAIKKKIVAGKPAEEKLAKPANL